jgi:TPR repeat protein
MLKHLKTCFIASGVLLGITMGHSQPVQADNAGGDPKQWRRPDSISTDKTCCDPKKWRKPGNLGNADDLYKTAIASMSDPSYLKSKEKKRQVQTLLGSAADKGHTQAAYLLGYSLKYGRNGIGQDRKRSLRYLEIAAKNEHAAAQYELGECYLSRCNGELIERKLAYQWLEKAALKGVADAMYRMGNYYHRKSATDYQHDHVGDIGFAYSWFRLAAAKKHAGAANELGGLYNASYACSLKKYAGSCRNYRDIAPDMIKAEYWYRKATEQGLADGFSSLGQLYLYWGKLFPKKHSTAYQYLEKAATIDPKRRDTILLGQMYARHIPQHGGTQADNQKALYWFGRAKAAGYNVDKYIKRIKNNSKFDWYAFGLLLGAITSSGDNKSNVETKPGSQAALTPEQAAYYECRNKVIKEERITYCSVSIQDCSSYGCTYNATCDDPWGGGSSCESAIEMSSSKTAVYYCDKQDKWNYYEDFESVVANICAQ